VSRPYSWLRVELFSCVLTIDLVSLWKGVGHTKNFDTKVQKFHNETEIYNPKSNGASARARAKRSSRGAVGMKLSESRLCYNKRSSRWRYRLGVRTEDSQSSNPGSIPGSATNLILSCSFPSAFEFPPVLAPTF
jgi:hypothetical protein